MFMNRHGFEPIQRQSGIHRRMGAPPVDVLIVAELTRCKETIGALLELQDAGRIRILGRVERGLDAFEAMTVLLPTLIIVDYRIRDMRPTPVSSLLSASYPTITLLVFKEGKKAQNTRLLHLPAAMT